MVKKVGMSEKVGLRVMPDEGGLSQAMVKVVDDEVKDMLGDSYKRAVAILKAHKKELDLLAKALLQYETLDVDDIKAIVEGSKQVQRIIQ